MRVGTSGLTVTTAFKRSSTTCYKSAADLPESACDCAYLGSRLLANLLDVVKLLLSGLLRVFLGLLVAAGVLQGVSCCSSPG